MSMAANRDTLEADPCVTYEDRRPQPIGNIKEVDIGNNKKIKIGVTLTEQMEKELTKVLKKNMNVFFWLIVEMLGIDTNFLFHRLAINLKEKTNHSETKKAR